MKKEKEIDILAAARRVFDIEISALKKTRDSLDGVFITILDMITKCEGKVIITGIGKPGHIAKKMASTFSSLGTPSFYLNPAEAMHGDLGMISINDIVIIISYSGESDEIIRIIPSIRMIGARIVALTGNDKSTLAKNADVVQIIPYIKEACNLGLAPTSSTTAELVYGDALAVVASMVYGFRDVDFGIFHPAGSLGKRIALRVEDVMVTGENNAEININQSLQEAIIEISKKAIGMVNVIDDERHLLGIITSGDLRRAFENKRNYRELSIADVMKENPYYSKPDDLVVNSLKYMTEHSFGAAPVIKEEQLIGSISVIDIIKAGVVDTFKFGRNK